MTGRPLEGIRVVEAGRFAAAPACATVLADWGASVIKVEPLTGDPARGPGSVPGGGDKPQRNPRYELHNRGRRSLAIDLTNPASRPVAQRLVANTDVFLTNMRTPALARLGLDWEHLRTVDERLVYAQISGYGPDSDRPSYDHGAFWSESGAAALYTVGDGPPPIPAGGLGDRSAALAAAAGILAALVERERTGRGQKVDVSLLAIGSWLLGSDVSDALGGHEPPKRHRATTHNALLNSYRTKDGRWLWLQMMEPQRHWRGFIEAIDATWLDDDERFAGGERQLLRQSSVALIEILDGVFAQRTLAQWTDTLDAAGVWWAPVRTVGELAADPRTEHVGGVVQVGDGRAVASPCRFDGASPVASALSPQIGEHSSAILAELGLDEAEIAHLHATNVIA